KEERDEVAPSVLCANGLGHQQRRRVAGDIGTELLAGAGAYAIGDRFLVSNDPARHVPSRPEELVIAPGEQRARAIVLDEQIDVDQRGDAADEQEHVLGKAAPGIAEGGFKRLDATSQRLIHAYQRSMSSVKLMRSCST